MDAAGESTIDTTKGPTPPATTADTKARRKQADPTKAANAARKRENKAKLHAAIAQKACVHCLSVGLFEVYATKGRIRYLGCKACGRTRHNQVAV